MANMHYLNKLIDYLKLNPKQFSESLGFDRVDRIYNVLNFKNGISANLANIITNTYPSVNYEWLLTGKGEMLLLDQQSLSVDSSSPITIPIDEGQPILDIRICAGQGIGLYGSENKVLSWVNIPDFKGCVGLIVYGESMYDKYAPGDAVFVREISDCNYIENGQPYIVITKEDRLLKLVYIENEKLSLVSYNTVLNPDGRRTYPDMVISPDDILFLYKVVGKVARNQI